MRGSQAGASCPLWHNSGLLSLLLMTGSLFQAHPAEPPATPTAAPPAYTGGKFKLKPKVLPPPPPAGSATLPPPPAVKDATAPAAVLPPPLPPPPPEGQKAPPPFPVVAPPKTGKTAPPVPHVSLKTEPPEPEKSEPPVDAVAIAKKKRNVIAIATGAGVILLSGVVYLAVKLLSPAATPPPPPPAAKAKAPAPVAAKTPNASPTVAVVSTPAPAAPAATPAPGTPAGTPNSIAHLPANAINKAKGAVEARQASGQTQVDSAITGDAIADKPAIAPPAGDVSKAPAPRPAASARTSVTKGVSASTELENAGIEASAEFRSFVANAKVSGVFQGEPARAFINGRMVRTGEMVEANLGILFEGVDPVKRHLFFKDRSGALVTRKY